MELIKTSINGLFIIHSQPRGDDRGSFARTYCKRTFEAAGLNTEFVQFNHSLSTRKGTLRGMHFQKAPFAEAKLIRCVNGAVFDVATDLRATSATFMQSISVELSADNYHSVFIPAGCAHGFQTRTDNAALIYHHTAYYTPAAEDGFRYDDPRAAIAWPEPPVVISERDAGFSFLDKQFNGLVI